MLQEIDILRIYLQKYLGIWGVIFRFLGVQKMLRRPAG